ncbi:hypothetical protein B0H13DRAFT_1851477 [Mycena leptocephala]|nr:hypothetical protein B0H13DRAFT_1851477 [Mycena leptocephala]
MNETQATSSKHTKETLTAPAITIEPEGAARRNTDGNPADPSSVDGGCIRVQPPSLCIKRGVGSESPRQGGSSKVVVCCSRCTSAGVMQCGADRLKMTGISRASHWRCTCSSKWLWSGAGGENVKEGKTVTCLKMCDKISVTHLKMCNTAICITVTCSILINTGPAHSVKEVFETCSSSADGWVKTMNPETAE